MMRGDNRERWDQRLPHPYEPIPLGPGRLLPHARIGDEVVQVGILLDGGERLEREAHVVDQEVRDPKVAR